MTTPLRTTWIKECCAAALRIRDSFGLEKAFDYLVGEKLFSLVERTARHPEYREDLAFFVTEVRRIFAAQEIRQYLHQLKRRRGLYPAGRTRSARLLPIFHGSSEQSSARS